MKTPPLLHLAAALTREVLEEPTGDFERVADGHSGIAVEMVALRGLAMLGGLSVLQWLRQ